MTIFNKSTLSSRFGAKAQSYENATPVQEEMGKALLDRISELRSQGQIHRILEIGCGTGRLTRHLVTAFPRAKITALDISAEMVEYAKGKHPQASYVVADAENYLATSSESFDLIVSNATVQWFEDPDLSLTRARKLLNIGGLLAIATFAEKTFHELSASFNQAYIKCGLPNKNHVVPMRNLDFWKNLFPESEITDILVEKKFIDVRSFLHSIQLAGAVNSQTDRYAIPSRVLIEMINQYTKHFKCPSTDQITATYHVCYCFQNR